jgi:hypothetical protein
LPTVCEFLKIITLALSFFFLTDIIIYLNKLT